MAQLVNTSCSVGDLGSKSVLFNQTNYPGLFRFAYVQLHVCNLIHAWSPELCQEQSKNLINVVVVVVVTIIITIAIITMLNWLLEKHKSWDPSFYRLFFSFNLFAI